MTALTLFTLDHLPDIRPGDDLAALMIDALESQQRPLQQGDILVIAQKVVSKAENAIVHIDSLTPSDNALSLAAELNKDPRKVELVLQQSSRVLRAHKHPRADEGVLITQHRLGFISANAAVDESNADKAGQLICLPTDPDASARALCARLEHHFQCQLGVIISDTFGRPWRLGQTNVAIGLANVPALNLMAGQTDAWGRPLKVTAPALADELAAASGLLMSKQGKCPVIIFRGLDWQPQCSSAQELLRPIQEDLFQ